MTYFDSIIGQDSIKAHLSELVSRNALPHSLLFYGEAGLGKLDMAIGLASLLLGRQVFSQPKGEALKKHVLPMVRPKNALKQKVCLSIWIRGMPFGFVL